MRALDAARLEDLGPNDRVKIECAACKHVNRIAVTASNTASAAESVALAGAALFRLNGLIPRHDRRLWADCD